MLSGRSLLLVALVVLVVVPIGAAAQANNSTTTTPTAEANETARIAVSSTLTVLDYRYADGSMVVDVRSDLPAQVTVTDVFGAIPENGGASRIEGRTVQIPRGRTTIRIDAEPYNGLAVVTVSSRGEGVTLAERVSSPMIGGPWTADDARSAGLGALVGSLSLVGLLGFRKVRGVGSDARRLI